MSEVQGRYPYTHSLRNISLHKVIIKKFMLLVLKTLLRLPERDHHLEG